jgi:hypothetical protein
MTLPPDIDKNEGEPFCRLALYHSAHSWRRSAVLCCQLNINRFVSPRNMETKCQMLQAYTQVGNIKT